MRNYIPVKKHWFEMYIKFDKPYFVAHRKFPIEKIKVDKSYYADKQEMFKADMLYMLVNFDREAWAPVIINKSGLLVDGYHRVAMAKQKGLLFIDVVIEDTELLEGRNKKEGNGNKRRSKEMRRLESKLKKVWSRTKDD